MKDVSLNPHERMRTEIAAAERVLALGERLVESKRRRLVELRAIAADPVRRNAYLMENYSADGGEAMTQEDLRELMRRVGRQFEATDPPRTQETRDVRGRWLYADVALEKGRADGEERATAWLAEMEGRGFVG